MSASEFCCASYVICIIVHPHALFNCTLMHLSPKASKKNRKKKPSFRKLLKTSNLKLENKLKNRQFKQQSSAKKQRKEQRKLRQAITDVSHQTLKPLERYKKKPGEGNCFLMIFMNSCSVLRQCCKVDVWFQRMKKRRRSSWSLCPLIWWMRMTLNRSNPWHRKLPFWLETSHHGKQRSLKHVLWFSLSNHVMFFSS